MRLPRPFRGFPWWLPLLSAAAAAAITALIINSADPVWAADSRVWVPDERLPAQHVQAILDEPQTFADAMELTLWEQSAADLAAATSIDVEGTLITLRVETHNPALAEQMAASLAEIVVDKCYERNPGPAHPETLGVTWPGARRVAPSPSGAAALAGLGGLLGGLAAAAALGRTRPPSPPSTLALLARQGWRPLAIIPAPDSVIPAQAGTHPTVIPAQAGTTPAPEPVIPAQAGTTPAPEPVIPAQAGTHPTHASPPTPPTPTPFPNSSLPPSRGEARWGVGGNEHTTAPAPTTPAPPIVIPAQAGTTPAPPATPAPPTVTPAPPTVIPAQAGTTPHTHPPPIPPFPNSSLPPSRGEARWGVGRNEHTTIPATTTPPPSAQQLADEIEAAPNHGPVTAFLPLHHDADPEIPARQAARALAGRGRNILWLDARPPTPTILTLPNNLLNPPTPFHPIDPNAPIPTWLQGLPIPPKPEQLRTLIANNKPRFDAILLLLPPLTPAPPTVIPAQAGTAPPTVIPAQAGTLRSPPVIPAQAGTLRSPPVIPAQAGTTPHTHPPFPNSSLPPSRGEARWGVGHNEHTTAPSPTTTPSPTTSPSPPPATPAPDSVIPAPPSVIPAQAGTLADRIALTARDDYKPTPNQIAQLAAQLPNNIPILGIALTHASPDRAKDFQAAADHAQENTP